MATVDEDEVTPRQKAFAELERIAAAGPWGFYEHQPGKEFFTDTFVLGVPQVRIRVSRSAADESFFQDIVSDAAPIRVETFTAEPIVHPGARRRLLRYSAAPGTLRAAEMPCPR
jgi:hypothetical protein